MIDDKKIEEAATVASISDTEKGRVREGYVINALADHENGYREGYIEGAKWAINEFIKDLWHPANKIPKKFNHYGFAALYILQYNHQIRMILYYKDNMSWKNVISNSEYWLYVDDLLPKQEGGEQ